MTALEILRAARELLSDEKRWTRNVYALDVNGWPVFGEDPRAVRWCAHGAIDRFGGPEAEAAAEALRDQVPLRRVADFNDTTDHASVLAAFDRAIARLEQQP